MRPRSSKFLRLPYGKHEPSDSAAAVSVLQMELAAEGDCERVGVVQAQPVAMVGF